MIRSKNEWMQAAKEMAPHLEGLRQIAIKYGIQINARAHELDFHTGAFTCDCARVVFPKIDYYEGAYHVDYDGETIAELAADVMKIGPTGIKPDGSR